MALKFGILGAGMISSLHADALRHSTKAELVAVADVDKGRAEKLANEYAPGAKAYGSLAEMLADPRVEAVSVVTPNHLHTDAVLAIAKAGKHVMCEKPPAMSLKETDKMIAACNKAKVKFGIFVQCRIRAPIQQMKKALDEGRFGKVLRADAVMKWYRAGDYYKRDAWRSDRKSGAGVTIQHAFHYIDLLQYLMGPAKQVAANMYNLAHPDVYLEDTLEASIVFETGVKGTVHASTAMWPGSDVRIEIYGEKGCAIMEGAAFRLWQFQEERPEDKEIRAMGDSKQVTAGGSPTALAYVDHQVVYDDCADAVSQGHEVAIPCAAVRPTLEMALSMYKSAKTGKPAVLPLKGEKNIW